MAPTKVGHLRNEVRNEKIYEKNMSKNVTDSQEIGNMAEFPSASATHARTASDKDS